MATRDDHLVMELRLRLDKAERELSKFVKKAERTQINLKGIDHKKFTQPLGKITGSVSEFQKSLDASNARVIAFSASAGILMGVTKAFTEMARATIDVEKSLKDINVILGASTRNLQKFGNSLFNIANDTGQAFATVAEAATEFARQGLSMEKTLLRTRDALILTRLSGMDATASVNALTAAINSFSKSALTSTEIINRLANVDAAFAVSTTDLAEAIRRVGASADDVNVSFNELIAVVTSVQQTTARGGNVIGNSLKTIFTRIQRTEVVSQLQALGVQVRDIQGNMRPAMRVLSDFAKVYDSLTPSIKAQTAELVGGVYQMNILKSILKDLKNDYSIFNQALGTANKSMNEAVERNEELNKTLSALLNETMQNLTKLGAQVGSLTLEPVFRQIMEGFNALSKKSSVFGDIGALFGFDEKEASEFGGKLGKGILKSIGSLLQGPGFILIGTILGKLFLDFTKFLTKSVADFMNLNKTAQQQAALQQQIRDTLAQNPQLIDSINNKEQTRYQVEQKILTSLKNEIILREKIAKLSMGSGSRAMAQGFGAQIDKASGTTNLTYNKQKSRGFVPNFSDIGEYVGALSGGYKPGDIREMYINGEGKVKYNTAERVKKFPGMVQQAIMPPEGSEAGMSYRKKFKKAHGFDPYASDGHVPNFLNVLTSMRTSFDKKGSGSTGRMGDMLSASREQLIKSQGVPTWLQGVLGSALRPGEMVRIKTMGQLSGITPQERSAFTSGTGKAGHLKGAQMESALAGRKGNFSWGQRFAAPGGTGQLAKMPVDLGTTSKTGRNYPIESKPELKTKQIGQIFLKTLYENNSNSLRQLRSRLKTKADAGDTVAGAHLDRLQSVITEQTRRRGGEISKYSAGGVNSLYDFNAAVGFDSRNAIKALREKQAGLDVFSSGFVPNFAAGMQWGRSGQRKGRAVNIGSLATMLVPQPDSQVKSPIQFLYNDTKYSVPVKGYSSAKMKSGTGFEGLHSDVKKSLTKVARRYSQKIDPPLNRNVDPAKYYNQGAIASATGTLFEAAIDAAFDRNVDKEGATWDVRGGTKGTSSVRKLFGDYVTKHADYKNSITKGNLNSMAKKFENERGLKKAYGFVPNFSAIGNAFDTERSMGGKPVLDYQPGIGLYVRDEKTQKNFGDVLKDHPEGIGNAIKNSKAMQDVLAAEGHVPNFQAGTNLDLGMVTMGMGMFALGLKDAVERNRETVASGKALDDQFDKLRDEVRSLGEKTRELGKENEKGAEEIKKHSQAIKSDKDKLKQKKDEIRAAESAGPDKNEKARQRRAAAAAARAETIDPRTGAPIKAKDAKSAHHATQAKLKRKTEEHLAKIQQKELKLKQERLQTLQKEKLAIQKRIQAGGKDIRKQVELRGERDKLKGKIREEIKAKGDNIKAIRKEATAHNKNASLAGGSAKAGEKASLGTRAANTYSNAAMGMMMAMPMVGGAARAMGANEGVVTGIEQGAGVAMMGAMTGNPYAMVGTAVIGAGVATHKIIKSLKDETGKFKAEAEQAAEKLTTFSNASSSFLQNLEGYQSILQDADADPANIMKRQQAMFESLNEMPSAYRATISAALGDTEKIKQAFADIRKDLERSSKEAQQRQKFAEYQNKEWGFFDSMQMVYQAATGGGPNAANEKSARPSVLAGTEGVNIKARQQAAASVLQDFDFLNQVSDLAPGPERRLGYDTQQRENELLARIRKTFMAQPGKSPFPGSQKDRMAEMDMLLKDLAPNMSAAMRQALIDESVSSQGWGGHALGAELSKFVRQAFEAAQETKKLEIHMKRLRRESDRSAEEMRELQASASALHQSMGTIIRIADMRLARFQGNRLGEESAFRQMADQNLSGSIKLASPFLRRETKATAEDRQSRLKINSKMTSDLEKALNSSQSKFLALFRKEQEGISKKIIDLEVKKAKDPTKGPTRTEEKERKLAITRQKMFGNIIAQTVSDIGNKPLAAIPDIVNSMAGKLSKAGMNKEEIKKLENAVLELKEESVGKLQGILQKAETDLQIQKLRARQQQELIAQDRRLKFGGGPSGFLGGPRTKKMDELRARRARSEINPFNQTQVRGAADFAILDQLVNTFQYDLNKGNAGAFAFDPLIGSAFEGLKSEMIERINSMEAAALLSARPEDTGKLKQEFQGLRDRAGDAAMDQIAKQLKIEDLPLNVEQISFHTKMMAELLNDQMSRAQSANKDAFKQALTELGMDKIPKLGDKELWSNVASSGTKSINDSLRDLVRSFNAQVLLQNKSANLAEATKLEREGLAKLQEQGPQQLKLKQQRASVMESASELDQMMATLGAAEAQGGVAFSTEQRDALKKLKEGSFFQKFANAIGLGMSGASTTNIGDAAASYMKIRNAAPEFGKSIQVLQAETAMLQKLLQGGEARQEFERNFIAGQTKRVGAVSLRKKTIEAEIASRSSTEEEFQANLQASAEWQDLNKTQANIYDTIIAAKDRYAKLKGNMKALRALEEEIAGQAREHAKRQKADTNILSFTPDQLTIEHQKEYAQYLESKGLEDQAARVRAFAAAQHPHEREYTKPGTGGTSGKPWQPSKLLEFNMWRKKQGKAPVTPDQIKEANIVGPDGFSRTPKQHEEWMWQRDTGTGEHHPEKRQGPVPAIVNGVPQRLWQEALERKKNLEALERKRNQGRWPSPGTLPPTPEEIQRQQEEKIRRRQRPEPLPVDPDPPKSLPQTGVDPITKQQMMLAFTQLGKTMAQLQTPEIMNIQSKKLHTMYQAGAPPLNADEITKLAEFETSIAAIQQAQADLLKAMSGSSPEQKDVATSTKAMAEAVIKDGSKFWKKGASENTLAVNVKKPIKVDEDSLPTPDVKFSLAHYLDDGPQGYNILGQEGVKPRVWRKDEVNTVTPVNRVPQTYEGGQLAEVKRSARYKAALSGDVQFADGTTANIRQSLRGAALRGEDTTSIEQRLRQELETLAAPEHAWPPAHDAPQEEKQRYGQNRARVAVIEGQLEAIELHREQTQKENDILKRRERIAELKNTVLTEEEQSAKRQQALDELKKIAQTGQAEKIATLTADLAEARAAGLSYSDELAAINDQLIDAKIRAGEYNFTDTIKQIGESWNYTQKEQSRDYHNLMKGLTTRFKQGTTDAFFEAFKGNKKLKDSFSDLFGSLGDMITKMLIEMALNKYIFSPLGGMMAGARGGLVSSAGIKGYSTGGVVEGGSGVKDDVPAKLSRGEYVIRKSAVNKYGMSFLNTLNSGSVPTNIANSTDPQANLTSLIEHTASNKGAYARFNLRNAFIYDSNKPAAGAYSIDPRLSMMALTDEDNPRNQFRMDKASKLMDYWAERRKEIDAWKKSVEEWRTKKRKGMQRTMWLTFGLIAANAMFGKGDMFGGKSSFFGKRGYNPLNWFGGGGGANINTPGITDLNTGRLGMIGATASKGMYAGRDNIPAMLMGGEYVVNADAVKRHGVGFFHDLNAGRLRKFADGGYVGGESVSPAPGEPLGSGEPSTNNITINVNVDQNGGVTGDAEGGMNPERGRELANMIKMQVVNTIVEQKRQGGILYQS